MNTTLIQQCDHCLGHTRQWSKVNAVRSDTCTGGRDSVILLPVITFHKLSRGPTNMCFFNTLTQIFVSLHLSKASDSLVVSKAVSLHNDISMTYDYIL